MIMVYTEKWWIPLLRGLFALLFGVAALVFPVRALHVILLFFAIYLILDGIVTGATAFFHRHTAQGWWMLLFEGLLGLLLGILVIAWPRAAVIVLIFLFAFWAVVTGFLEIAAGLQIRKIYNREWLLILTGVLSIFLGVILFLNPGVGVLALVWIWGVFLTLFGILQVIFAFRLRKRRYSPDFEVVYREYQERI